MDYTHLGRTGLSVSRLCLGTMNFGPVTTSRDSHAIMDRAHELGINFFDTANVLRLEEGRGHHRADHRPLVRPGRRAARETVLATKLYGDMGDWPNDGPLSALQHPPGLRRVAAAAADRLHRPLPDAPRRPGHAVGRDLGGHGGPAQQGKILYVGSSNFAGWHIAKAQEAARRRGSIGLVSEQSIYNLLTRDVELEVLPAAQDYGARRHPVVAAARRPARRHPPQERDEGAPAHRRRAKEALEDASRPRSRPTRTSATSWRGAGRRRAGLAAAPAGGHRADHRPAHHRPARRLASGRSEIRLDERR